MTPPSTVLLAGSVICLLLALHPFTTYPLSLRLLARLRPAPLRVAFGSGSPSVAICVCAYNEESVIEARIRNILSLPTMSAGLEILVYVDGATDRTAEILSRFGSAITMIVSPTRLGKTIGMNTLVDRSSADILVFSDANVSFASDAVERLVAPFADPAVGCVCGHLRYADAMGETAQTGSLYWRLEEHIKSLESRTGSVMGADGSIFAIRRSLHRRPPPYLIDDMFVSLSVLCGGARIVRAADAIAYEAAVSTSNEEFRRKVRIACQAFNVHRAMHASFRRLGTIDRFKYVSHKLLRWLSIFFLATSGLLLVGAASAAQAWMLLTWLLAFAAAGGTAIMFARRGPATRVREILAALIATGLGVLQSLRGEQYQTWTPPASARSMAFSEAGHA